MPSATATPTRTLLTADPAAGLNPARDLSWSPSTRASFDLIPMADEISVIAMAQASPGNWQATGTTLGLPGVTTTLTIEESEQERRLASLRFAFGAGRSPDFMFSSLSDLGGWALSGAVDALKLSEGVVTICETVPMGDKRLKEGFNFSARLSRESLPEIFSPLASYDGFSVHGTYAPESDHPPSCRRRRPWQLAKAPPGTVLNIPIGDRFELADLFEFSDIVAHLYLPPSDSWARRHIGYHAQAGLSGQLRLKANTQEPVIARFSAIWVPGSGFVLESEFTGASLGNIATLPGLSAAKQALDGLPDGLKDLSRLQLQRVYLALGESFSRETLQEIALTLNLPGRITIPGVEIGVANPTLELAVRSPFGAHPSARADLVALTQLGPVDLETSIGIPEGRVRLALPQDASLDAFVLLDKLAPEARKHIGEAAELTIDELEMEANLSSRAFRFHALLASSAALDIPLAGTTLELSDIGITYDKPGSGKASYELYGTVDFAEKVQLALSASSDTGFVGTVTIPKFSLGELLAGLGDGHGLRLPDGFDLEFQQTRLELAASTDEFRFMASTLVTDCGALGFAAQRQGAGWGFVMALRIDDGGFKRLAEVAPSVGGPIRSFADFVGLESMLLAVASADISDFTLPEAQPKITAGPTAAPAPAAAQSLMPKSFTKGITLYARIRLDNPALKALGDLIVPPAKGKNPMDGVSGRLDARIHIGLPNPSSNSSLAILIPEAKIGDGRLSGEFGLGLRGGTPEVFLTGEYEGKLDGQPFTATVMASVMPNGMMLGGAVKGEFTITLFDQPVKLANLAFMLGVSLQGMPSVGFNGKFTIGSVEGSMALLINANNPANSMIAGSITDLELDKIAADLAGQSLPDELRATLSEFSLTSIEVHTAPADIGLRDALEAARPKPASGAAEKFSPKADASALQRIFASKAFADQGLKLPDKAENISLHHVPYTTHWYVMNMETLQHTQIKLKSDGSATIHKSAQIYIAPTDTQIVSFKYEAGFRVSGRLKTPVGGAYADIMVDSKRGIDATGRMDRIVLIDPDIFDLASGEHGSKDGPSLSILSFEKAGRKPHAKISGSLRVFTHRLGKFHGEFSADKLSIEGEIAPPGPWRVGLSGEVNDERFMLEGRVSFTVIPYIGIGPLGKFNFETGLDTKLGIETKEKFARVEAHAGISARVLGAVKDIGTLIIGTSLDRLDERIIEFVEQELGINPKKLIANAEEFAALAVHHVDRFASVAAQDIAEFMNDKLDFAAEEATKLIKDIGKTAEEVGRALQSAYELTGEAAAEALKAADFAVGEVAGALKSVYGFADETAATALRHAGYAAEDVGKALKDVYDLADEAAATALRHAGYAAEDVGRALKDVYDLADEAAATALRHAGYAAEDVGKVLKDVYDVADDAAAAALRHAGYALDDVSNALKNVYDLGDQALTDALKAGGYAAQEVDRFFGKIGAAVGGAIDDAADAIGSAAEDVGDALSGAADDVGDAASGAWRDFKNLF